MQFKLNYTGRLYVSNVRFNNTPSLHCIVCSLSKVKSPSVTLYLIPFILFYSLHLHPPPRNHHSDVCVCKFLVCSFVAFSFISHTWVKSCSSCPFPSDSFHSARHPQDPPKLSQVAVIHRRKCLEIIKTTVLFHSFLKKTFLRWNNLLPLLRWAHILDTQLYTDLQEF